MAETLPYFYYKETKSLDEHLYIQKKNTYAGAQRDVTFLSVPGRDGDLIVDNNRFKNVDIYYKVAVLEGVFDVPEIAHRVKSWLSSEPGYFELIDSYDPNYYRLAAYADQIDLEQEMKCWGTATVKFKCKPYKYRLDGRHPITLSAAQMPKTVRNPENFASKPYIKITGSGIISLKINGKAFSFSDVDGYIEVDSETMNAYKGASPQNSKMISEDFPELLPGDNAIDYLGTVSSVEIIPRWRCL